MLGRRKARAGSCATPSPGRRAPVASQERLLYAAIADVGESVRANDAKASAALVLHGLVFAGITTLLTKLSGAYEHASTLERVIALGALGVTFASFLASAFCLVAAVSPYRPRMLDARLEGRYRRVFFPVGDVFDAASPHEEMSRRLDGMGELDVRDELVAEVLKLVAILNHESHQTKWGYRLLRVELAAAAAFFVTVAVSSL